MGMRGRSKQQSILGDTWLSFSSLETLSFLLLGFPVRGASRTEEWMNLMDV